MTNHSVLPPSSAARRMLCPGSRYLESLVSEPEVKSKYAEEGTIAHLAASTMLKNNDRAYRANTIDGHVITNEMWDNAVIYFEYVTGINKGSKLHIEETIDISTIHSECFGTPDCWFYQDETLHVFDYKYGFNPVKAKENWQLLEYAAGIVQKLQISTVPFRLRGVCCHIAQPRINNFSSWRYGLSSLPLLWDKLRESEQRAMSIKAEATPSAECHFCKAKYSCRALRDSTLRSVEISQRITYLEKILPPEELGNELRQLTYAKNLLDARILGLSTQAESMLAQGQRVPFFRLNRGKSHIKWQSDLTSIKQISSLYDVKVIKDEQLITPLQAIKAGIPKEIVNAYTEVIPGSMKLTPDDEAKEIFNKSIDKMDNDCYDKSLN